VAHPGQGLVALKVVEHGGPWQDLENLVGGLGRTLKTFTKIRGVTWKGIKSTWKVNEQRILILFMMV
jgi:hypothetical protein